MFWFSAPALRFEVYFFFFVCVCLFFKYLFSSTVTLVVMYFTSPTRACVGKGGLCEHWLCCTLIGEDVKLVKKILKSFLFFFLSVF